MQATKPSVSVPAPVTKKYGQVTVTASRTVEGGYAINTFVGAERIDALSSTTADRDLYRFRYAQIRDFALQGFTVEQIAARINGQSAAAVVEANEVITSALADLAALGRHRQVRPTMAGAHLADLSEAGQRAINNHRNGVVYPGGRITRPTLAALARQGYGTLTFEGRRKRITALTLNKAGKAATVAAAPMVEVAVHNGSNTLVGNTAAARRYAADITWQPVGRVEDDDTHVIAVIGGEPGAVGKALPVVIRVNSGEPFEVPAAGLLNVAVA